MKYKVWDCLCSEVIKYYKSKYWALRRAKKEIKERNLLPNSIVVFEDNDFLGRKVY